jgi:hypothetical protein
MPRRDRIALNVICNISVWYICFLPASQGLRVDTVIFWEAGLLEQMKVSIEWSRSRFEWHFVATGYKNNIVPLTMVSSSQSIQLA